MEILSFGHAIRRRRESRRLGLRALARATSLSPSYLSRIERNLVPPPTAAVIARLADALDVDAEQLLEAAGIVPEGVLSFIRTRPGVAVPLITLLGRMSDEALAEALEELRRRGSAADCAPFQKQETNSRFVK